MLLRRLLGLPPRTAISEEVRATLAAEIPNSQGRTAFEVMRCSHCGGIHLHACPRVKQLVFNGSQIGAVEFWPDGKWSTEHVIWPWEIFTTPIPAPDPAEVHPPVPELRSPAS